MALSNIEVEMERWVRAAHQSNHRSILPLDVSRPLTDDGSNSTRAVGSRRAAAHIPPKTQNLTIVLECRLTLTAKLRRWVYDIRLVSRCPLLLWWAGPAWVHGLAFMLMERGG